jgi:serine/threonine protein kinase
MSIRASDAPDRQLWFRWRKGERPDVQAFLAGIGSLSAEQIAAVLIVDQWERWTTGERVPAESYLRDFPVLSSSADAAFDVVYGEFLLRERLGESPQRDEFARRFPAFADRLDRQVQLHQAVSPRGPSAETSEPHSCPIYDPSVPPTMPTRSAPPIGGWPRVPGYEILAEVGQGGMAAVFRARQLSLNRVVALKLIPHDRLDSADLDGLASHRLRREAQALARLSHPNIVAIYDAGETRDVVYFAMEYVEGVDLQKRVDQQGPLPVAEAVEYIRQAALGLQHAHEQGLVHRDIKPANLIVQAKQDAPPSAGDTSTPSPPVETGQPVRVKLLDLGLARVGTLASGADDGLTKVGAFVGTPDFAAPEQADDARRADIRSDLYSLGCTFYFLLAGRVPFPGITPLEKLVKHRLEEAPPIESWRPDIPMSVSAVLRKLMAKRPADRYQSPAELGAALPSLPLAVPGGEPPPPVPLVRRPSSLELAPSVVLRRTPGELALPSAGPAPLRRLVGHADWVKAVVFSPDGRRLLTASLDRTLRLWDVDLGVELARETAHEDGVLCAALSADGASALTGGVDRAIRRWSLADGLRVLTVLRGHAENVNDIAFSPDSLRAVSASHDGTVRMWDLASASEIARFTGHAGPVWSALFSPDGMHIFTCGRDATVRVWNASTGAEHHRWTGWGERHVCTLSLSPDGKTLAAGNTDGTVVLCDAVDGRELCVLNGHAGKVNVVRFAPGGRLLSGGRDQTLRLWDMTLGRELSWFRGHAHWVTGAAVSSDGRIAASASADRTVCLWSL